MSNTAFSKETEIFNLFGLFLESAINCFLFQRQTYPRAAFSPFTVFGVQIQVCTNPDVKTYINECVESLRTQFSFVRELRVVVKLPADSSCYDQPEYLECLVIRFDRLNEEFVRWDRGAAVLRDYFATALLRLNMLECTYPPFDHETTWELRVRLASEDSNLSHTTPMSWYMSDRCTQRNGETTLFPIISFDNENVQMQLLYERQVNSY